MPWVSRSYLRELHHHEGMQHQTILAYRAKSDSDHDRIQALRASFAEIVRATSQRPVCEIAQHALRTDASANAHAQLAWSRTTAPPRTGKRSC